MAWTVDRFASLRQQEYAPEQWVAWCRLIISHEAVSLRRKYGKWKQDGLSYNNEETTILPIQTVESDFGFGTFSWVEWRLLFQTELNEIERCVVLELYVNDATQRQTAQHCGMSQAQVSRVHRRACHKLREALAR